MTSHQQIVVVHDVDPACCPCTADATAPTVLRAAYAKRPLQHRPRVQPRRPRRLDVARVLGAEARLALDVGVRAVGDGALLVGEGLALALGDLVGERGQSTRPLLFEGLEAQGTN